MKTLTVYFFFSFLVIYNSLAQSTQLALDGTEWINTEAYEVKGRMGLLLKQKLSFGNYYTTSVKRSWTKGSGLTTGIPAGYDYRKLIKLEYINKKQTIVFHLQDSLGTEAEAYCVSKFNGKDLNFGDDRIPIGRRVSTMFGIEFESSNLFYVQIYTGRDQAPWHLILDNEAAQQTPKSYEARLVQSQHTFYRIVPDTRIMKGNGKVMNMPFGSAGFRIINSSGEPVAAVSMIDKGVIYFNSVSTEERILLGTVCTALLLQEQI